TFALICWLVYADPSCFTPGGASHGTVHWAPHGPNSNGHGNGHRNGHHGAVSGLPSSHSSSSSSQHGISDEAKATILHLRESLVRQKETILDQGHHDDNHHGKSQYLGKHCFSPEQTGKTLQALKERLENLQARNSSSSYSSSLRDLLQHKINALEEQLHHHYVELLEVILLRNAILFHSLLFSSLTGPNKKPKNPDAFQIGFPMRTNYMYGRIKCTLLSEIFALTVCLWLKGGSGPGIGTPFSYSVPGQANELVLIEWGNNPMELLVNDKVKKSSNYKTGFVTVITWSTRDGMWEAYLDGVKRGSGENLSPWHSIKPGGVFILGQEQDTLGGRFDATQSFVGEMSDLQLWSRVLTSTEIYNKVSCSSHLSGDVITWSESMVELHGGVTKYPFDPCH
uniref:Si:dkey-14o18.2 n=1 Tax=Sinocyclocheilus rhinocerous TaxID=307959 RepID=A0A673FSB0_9TELE